MCKEHYNGGILFFDLKNYSKLNDLQIKIFHEKIWSDLYNIIKNYRNTIFFCDTWGDGIVLLGIDLKKLTSIALKWRDYFNKHKYIKHGEDIAYEELEARISLHRGNFRKVFDEFQGRYIYYGLQIIKGARIEQTIRPKEVWASINFKKEIDEIYQNDGKTNDFRFDPIGKKELAKAFGTELIYIVN